ncbi:hypothetical protein HQ585_20805 [candidate division KSB1 bacterium]|nr:hypothetical protein [candidate division KSB1 bacterium]
MNKRKAAAIAGVMHYLQEERSQQEDASPYALPHHRINPWACFGRRTTARLNKLVQLQLFRKHHFCPDHNQPEKGFQLQRAKWLGSRMCRSVSYRATSRMQTSMQPRDDKKE